MPRQRRNMLIQPPLGGKVRRLGKQNQPPFSSYDLDNFWGFDAKTGRETLATRPALANIPAAASTCNAIVPVNGFATGKPRESMIGAFNGSLYWWDETAWRPVTGGAKSLVDTGKAVYGATFLQRSYICKDSSAPIAVRYAKGDAELLTASEGIVPTDCRVAQTWQGCLWLAGREEEPHVLFGSRSGDPYDWNFDAPANDQFGAVWTGGPTYRGRLSGPITALANHTADTMIVSTTTGLTALRGHPRRGGVFDTISSDTYILGQGAWTHTPDGSIYYLSQHGLYMIGAQAQSKPIPVSKTKIPDELIGLKHVPDDPKISMSYSTRWEVIYITVRDATSPQAWKYSIRHGAFYPMTLDEGYPYVMHEHKPLISEDACGVLFGRS